VKAFNDEKGWGHIACEATRAIYGKDIFVMRSALRCGKIAAGDQVSFTITETPRGPQAMDVYSLEKGADWSTHVTAGRMFFGTVKLFSEEKGWGFVDCPDTHAMFGKDMFVHKREFTDATLGNGSVIQFQVEIGRDGRPEAKGVALASPDQVTGALANGTAAGTVMAGMYGAAGAAGDARAALRSSPY